MLKVAHLLKFLTEINPHTSPVRLALYNFIKSFYRPDEELNHSVLINFFNQVLEYPHWCANRSHLGHEVQLLLKNFNGFYQNKFDLSLLRFPETMQILEIDNSKDCEELLMTYLKHKFPQDYQIKLLLDQKKWLAFVLSQTEGLTVFQFDKRFIIRNGMLEPLRDNLNLKYDTQLELMNDRKQFFEISPHHLIQFQMKDDKVSGVITRGYMFQKIQDFQDLKAHEIPRLFWTLKRTEQFFIRRDSDPFYQDLIKKLKDISQGLWEKNSESWQNYMSILLSQSDSALESVYIGDKYLEELVLKVRQILMAEKSEICQPIQPKSNTQPPLQTQRRIGSDLTNF